MQYKSKIKYVINQFVIISCVFTAVAVILGDSFLGYLGNSDKDVVAKMKDETIIVIDPGHGGEDGGAVATDGTAEKDLNLGFGKTLLSICKICILFLL